MGHQFVGALGGGVELQRVAGAVFFAKGHLGVGTVDAAGAGVGQVRCLRVAAGFQDVGEGDDVAFNVAVRVLDGVAHAGLGGQVDNPVEPVFAEAGFHCGAVCQVGADEGVGAAGFGGGGFQLLQPRFFQGGVVVVVDAVEADHAVAAFEQPLGGVKADEAGVTGDEYVHNLRSVCSAGKRYFRSYSTCSALPRARMPSMPMARNSLWATAMSTAS